LIGETIANYRITSLLAKERGRAIYVAEDVQHDRALAIQVWQPGAPDHARAARQPPNDARVANALEHPNIAQVFEAGISEGAYPYQVMEPLDGETLAGRLRVQACVRVAEAVAIAREAAGALVAAHEAGIVHGQLTPASLFITLDPTAGRGERVKLLDFGTATRTEEEQVDARVDCRALAEILFEMLCGAPPCLVERAGEGPGSDADPLPASPRSINPDIPQPLDDLIARALAPDQGNDPPFATMAELRRALDSLALGPVAMPAPTPSDPPECAEAPAAPSLLSTSAFDVPPVALPPAPAAPLAAAPPGSGLLAWLRALVAPPPRRRARTAASVALVALGVALSILSSRTHATRLADRSSRRAAIRLPPGPAVAMTAPPLTMRVPANQPGAPLPPPFVGPPASPSAQGAGEGPCFISIGSRPWSEVWIDGNSTGHHTPLVRYKVPCGRRTLTLKNPALALAKSVVVTLKPRSRLKKIFRLGGPETARE
jgi:hypothetical protein